MPPRPHAFPPSVRVRRASEFKAVRAARRTVRDDLLELGWLKRGDGPARLGVIVPVRGLGAVGRNRVKRVLRAAFRLQRPELPAGYDFVVKPRDARRAADFAAASASFAALVKRATERERRT